MCQVIALQGQFSRNGFLEPRCPLHRPKKKRLLFECVNLVRWPYPPLPFNSSEKDFTLTPIPIVDLTTLTTFFHCFLSFFFVTNQNEPNTTNSLLFKCLTFVELLKLIMLPHCTFSL